MEVSEGASDGRDADQGDDVIDEVVDRNLDACGGEGNGATVKSLDAGAEMSKNQMKKLAKKERMEARKAFKKQQQKERHKAAVEQKRKEMEEKLAVMTEEEREAELRRKLEIRKKRLSEQEERKKQKARTVAAAKSLVIDLEFDNLMRDHEIKSLMQQLMYCYSKNAHAKQPYCLTFTGVQGRIKESLHNIAGFDKWPVVCEEKSYLDCFADRKGDLVYLTADSDTTLPELSPSHIYIIGGIVDRNRHKNLTLEKARRQGIATAKLPIGEHLKLVMSKVLTVNQVVEIMLKYRELQDWKQALLATVPERKRAAEDGGLQSKKVARTEGPEKESEGEARETVGAVAAEDDELSSEQDERSKEASKEVQLHENLGPVPGLCADVTDTADGTSLTHPEA